MFFSKCLVLTFLIALLNVFIAASENESNINLLKNEIIEAMKDCGESKDYRQAAKEVFETKSKSANAKVYGIEGNLKISKTAEEKDGQLTRIIRGTSNKKTLDGSNSEEWEYDDTSRRGSNGESWNDPKDDISIFDSVYGHERRNNSKSYGTNNNNDRSSYDQNSTKYNSQNDYGNNFDSRGARMVPVFGKLFNDKYPKSIRELNLTSNLYDPFMTRGIRSAETVSNRVKRLDKLMKNSNENEVDDRGIPKEVLFNKLLQGTITSLQSRTVLEGQLQACFDELASESEENACSYSNALDRCLGLQLKKRKSLANEAEESELIKVDA